MLKKALLLLGPTGSGKTPFGAYLQQNGLSNHRCFHFDFGAQLRDIADSPSPSEIFSDKEIAFIKAVLESGVLLENDTFYIAEKVLETFIERNFFSTGDLLVLNGLPRHIGQAEMMNALIDVLAVVNLECDADTVGARVLTNAGGDRTGRTDDSLEAIRKKLTIYKKRTIPLIGYYEKHGSDIITIPVTLETRPKGISDILNIRFRNTTLSQVNLNKYRNLF